MFVSSFRWHVDVWPIGSPALAVEHYRGLDLKQMQHDTLSHLMLSRASVFALTATGDLTYSSECIEANQIYVSNSQEVREAQCVG